MEKLKCYSSALLIACLFLFVSCNTNDPINDLSLEDTQVYMTDHDKSADFTTYKTFSVVDSVLIYGNQGSRNVLTNNDVILLERIIKNMQDLGYRYVSAADKPDLGINVAQVNNSYLNVVSQPIGSYWGGYYGGWGMGYPSYYSYYQVNESYWVFEMLDFKNANMVQKEVNVVWRSQIRGDGLNERTLIPVMIDKIFEQSSYLKNN